MNHARRLLFWIDTSVGLNKIWILVSALLVILYYAMNWQWPAWLSFLCGLDGFGRWRLSVYNGAQGGFGLTLRMVLRWICPEALASLSIFVGPETKSNRSQTADVIMASKPFRVVTSVDGFNGFD